MDNISIAVLCSLLGAAISYFTFQRGNKQDIKAETKEQTAIKTKLDYIAAAMDEIRLDGKARDREFKEMSLRLVKAEESLKAVHRRIDVMEEKYGKQGN